MQMARVNHLSMIKKYLTENFIFIEGIGFYNWNKIYWEKINDTKFKKYLLTMAKSKLSENEITGNLIDSIQKLAQLELFVSQESLNQNNDLHIVFKNGTYIIGEKKFYEDTFYKENYNTKIMNCSYKQGNLDTWNKYLSSTFKGEEECIELVQEMMGYILYPECNYEKSFILYGNGANGKSVLLNVMQELIGDYNTSYISMKDLEKSFLRSNLLDKSLNISSELEKSVGKTENFKKLVSGESVEAQFKYKDSFHFRNKSKLLFAMNQLSFISDLSDGLFRRISIIPFNNQFMKENRDPFLFEKLSKEIDAIAYWSIEGLVRMMSNNAFTTVKCVEGMTDELKENNNPILRFADDYLIITNDNEDSIEKIEVYNYYREWCSDNGNRAMNSNNFYKQINGDFKLESTRKMVDGKRLNCFLGVKILEDKQEVSIGWS